MTLRKTLFVLFFLPLFASAQSYTFPNGKVFAEFTTPTGVTIWSEIVGTIVTTAHADELSLADQIHAYIINMAQIYGANQLEMIATSNCESDWLKNPDHAIIAIGDYGKSYGVWQFWKKTFNKWKLEANMPELQYHNWQDATKLAAWAFSKGDDYKYAWTCYRKMIVEQRW